jgi:hypothetical protein
MDNLAEQAFASGLIDYAHKVILERFEIAAKNFNKFATVENLVESIDGDTIISTFRINENAFVYKTNTKTTYSEFKELSPVAAIEYVVERTGDDLSFMFEDILEAKEQLKNRINLKIDETYELIAFLKDQRNILADANKNISEIKEADNLINDEIKRFEDIINILENDELTKNNGFMDAELIKDYEGASMGTLVKVDALDYTTSAKDDMVTVMLDGEPMKVMKRHLEISSKDTI